jgi:hypothetical protein
MDTESDLLRLRGATFGNRQLGFCRQALYLSLDDRVNFFIRLEEMKSVMGDIPTDIKYSLSYNRFSTPYKFRMQILTQAYLPGEAVRAAV